MAHFFLMEPQQSSIYHSLGRTTLPTSSMKQKEPERSDSMFSSQSNTSPSNTADTSQSSRNNSASGATVRTWSHGPGAVVVERGSTTSADDELMLVPVKLVNKFRKSSVDGAEDLPGRPAPRSFFRRLSTRVSTSYDNSAAKEERYQIVKMPRREYNKFFKRDRCGTYLGSEEERTWDEQDLNRAFGAYQDAPLGPRV